MRNALIKPELLAGYSDAQAMSLACACGTANALEEKNGWIEWEKLDHILKNMIVSEKKA
jgi:fructose-1-phosphate kinase PfkB-like protein